MNFPFRCAPVWLLGFVVTTARAAEFSWPGHGAISIDTPQNWKLRGAPAGDVGYNFRGDTNSKSAAVLQITLAALPSGKSAPTGEEAKDRLESMVATAVPDSVEKKFLPHALKLRQGYGWYVELTDPSLVGKPPEPETLKVMRNAFAVLDQHTMVVITMQFDDPDSAAPDEMLGIVGSLRVQAGNQAPKSDTLQVERTDDFYELSVPPGRLKLKIPASGIAPKRANVGGATANPRYFNFAGINSGLVVSGWFESASRYSDLLTFWKGEVAGFKRGDQAEPVHVRYGKIGDWETIEYDTAEIPHNNHSHVRAELTRAGTWLDLHVSLTGDRPVDELRAELRTFIESLVVERR